MAVVREALTVYSAACAAARPLVSEPRKHCATLSHPIRIVGGHVARKESYNCWSRSELTVIRSQQWEMLIQMTILNSSAMHVTSPTLDNKVSVVS